MPRFVVFWAHATTFPENCLLFYYIFDVLVVSFFYSKPHSGDSYMTSTDCGGNRSDYTGSTSRKIAGGHDDQWFRSSHIRQNSYLLHFAVTLWEIEHLTRKATSSSVTTCSIAVRRIGTSHSCQPQLMARWMLGGCHRQQIQKEGTDTVYIVEAPFTSTS